ncbi:MAG: AarF/UbiB family protein [Balneolaceae bacterium]
MKNLSKYKDLALLLWKYGNSDLIKYAGLEDAVDSKAVQENSESKVSPDELVEDLKDMGPAFIKLGQLLSTRPDLLPPSYTEALANLQDQVGPFSYEEVREIVESELKVRISKAFNTFSEQPIASASLGQVHLAELANGETVVVKVQRPHIREKVMEDLEVLETTAKFLEKNTEAGKQFRFTQNVQQFKTSLLRELNYKTEAQNIKILEKNLSEFRHIVVPTPIDDYSTEKVLTMQYLKGKKITSISPLKKLELDGERLADELFQAYLKQILIDGFVHADPHPGNVHLMDDSHIALLDFGMVAHIPKNITENYLKLFLNAGDGEADEAVDIILKLSEKQKGADEKKFRSVISSMILENQNTTAKDLQTGRLILEMVKTAGKFGFLLPPEMSMIGKTMLNLDQAGRILAPDFNPNEAIQRHSLNLMNEHMKEDLTSYNLFSALLESKELIGQLPARLNKFFENAADNKLEFKINALDEEHLMKGFQKIANRITMGLILASLIIGSSLLMRVETNFTLFGYPGFAIITFIVAAIGAAILAFQILKLDEG